MSTKVLFDAEKKNITLKFNFFVVLKALMASVSVFIATCLHAQFPYGTPLINGNVELSVTIKTEEFCNTTIKNRTISDRQYQSKLTGALIWDLGEIKRVQKFIKERGLQGSAFALNNYTDTQPEDYQPGASNKKVPLFPLTVSIKNQFLGLHPCSRTYECGPDYTPTLINETILQGIAAHGGMQEIITSCQLNGIAGTNTKLIFGMKAAGSWFTAKGFEASSVKGKTRVLKRDEQSYDCKVKWESDDATETVIINSLLESGEISVTNDSRSEWKGSEGHYTRRTPFVEGISDECYEDIQLLTVDTSAFFTYVRERPEFKQFPLYGRYHMERKNGEQRTITTIEVNGTLTIGKMPSFSIAGTDEAAFKQWIPGSTAFPDNSTPVSITARFNQSATAKDTIEFTIDKVSRLPGFCTNYPLPTDPPVPPTADMYFAPQDKQTDPNIIILNDSTARTSNKVHSASVVLFSSDFGGYAQVSARAITTGERAESAYDSNFELRIPFDQNKNDIADQWEKDADMYDQGCNPLEDKDDLPTGIDNRGDGLTIFEEYRGFICEKDVASPADPKGNIRNGEHVRTSPHCRDVFVHDPDNIFARYYEHINPASCSWHYVSPTQIKLAKPEENKFIIDAMSTVTPDEKDQSPEAQAIWEKRSDAADLMTRLVKENYRCINPNTPAHLRVAIQCGMHIILNPNTTDVTGRTIGNSRAGICIPLRYTHIVSIPHRLSYTKFIRAATNVIILASKHPALVKRYTSMVIEQVADISYESMVPHEIGHGLGIDHHTKGSIKIQFSDPSDTMVVNQANLNKALERNTGINIEINHFDQKGYFITSIESALLALGVPSCTMRYTNEREMDLYTGTVLQPALQYCKKGDTFYDATGRKTDADECMTKIKISCKEDSELKGKK